jgi:hypothetical protein
MPDVFAETFFASHISTQLNFLPYCDNSINDINKFKFQIYRKAKDIAIRRYLIKKIVSI